MARIIWSTPALAQLEAIGTAIEVDNPRVAQAVMRRIWTEVEKLSTFQKLGRAIPEFRRPGYRQLWVHPCWVYHRASDNEVIIRHVRLAGKLIDLDDLI